MDKQQSATLSDLSLLPKVLLTGFGPFHVHKTNSSWLTIQELLKMDVNDFQIIAEEIPVEYETVIRTVPSLWEKHKPELVVHCGMSVQADCLVLEQIAHNNGYCSPDVQGKLPQNKICCKQGPDALCTEVDVRNVSKDVNSAGCPVKVVVSKDAGRYLCEFIFYASLKINRATVFIHVPPIDQPHSVEDLAKSLVVTIRSMLRHLKESRKAVNGECFNN